MFAQSLSLITRNFWMFAVVVSIMAGFFVFEDVSGSEPNKGAYAMWLFLSFWMQQAVISGKEKIAGQVGWPNGLWSFLWKNLVLFFSSVILPSLLLALSGFDNLGFIILVALLLAAGAFATLGTWPVSNAARGDTSLAAAWRRGATGFWSRFFRLVAGYVVPAFVSVLLVGLLHPGAVGSNVGMTDPVVVRLLLFYLLAVSINLIGTVYVSVVIARSYLADDQKSGQQAVSPAE
ncbi:hypothetical protein [Rhizobium sp. LC145]|uniref:hypothetical protein n=1 Tax=Rhizobium sp. LC145 TaxID=1120688 RepID=UPI00069B5ED0|nr:hypothetical protein [Rhizobium sp. LC145]TKT56138.1 hypothetical protein FDR95_16445 [Rhizobiaceae bacterium LC148]